MHHSRAKNIGIKHHFIIDHVLKGDIHICFIRTEFQLANILTKLLLEERIYFLRKYLSIIANLFKIIIFHIVLF